MPVNPPPPPPPPTCEDSNRGGNGTAVVAVFVVSLCFSFLLTIGLIEMSKRFARPTPSVTIEKEKCSC
jgi:hypothetical protein